MEKEKKKNYKLEKKDKKGQAEKSKAWKYRELKSKNSIWRRHSGGQADTWVLMPVEMQEYKCPKSPKKRLQWIKSLKKSRILE